VCLRNISINTLHKGDDNDDDDNNNRDKEVFLISNCRRVLNVVFLTFG